MQIEGLLRDQTSFAAIAGDHIEVPPAIALADPGEALAAVHPAEIVDDVGPGAVALYQNAPHPAGRRVAQHDVVGILKPVELLEDDLIRARGPIHPGDVVVSRVAGNLEPR